MTEALRKNLFLEFSMKHIAESEQEEIPTGTTFEQDDNSENHKKTGSDCCSDCCAGLCDNFDLILCECCCNDANSNGICDCVDCCECLCSFG